jgi:L-lactate dehydrogenase complex protein LldF
LGRFGQRFHPWVKGKRLDPAYAWTRTRELPPLAPQTFKEYWRKRRANLAEASKDGGKEAA